jgi:hypothetical protein
VFAIEIVSPTVMYVGGSFTMAGGNPANNIAVWDGTNYNAMSVGGINGPVYSITNWISMDIVVAGGSFTTAGGNPASNIAQWNGALWSSLYGGFDGEVRVVKISGDALVVGGNFNNALGTPYPVQKLAYLNGSIFDSMPAWKTDVGLNASVYAIGLIY